MQQHTARPWDLDFKSDHIQVWSPLPDNDKAIVAEVPYADVIGRTAQVEANARLIAAAPDLKAVARNLYRLSLVISAAVRRDGPQNLEQIIDLLKENEAALAKAEGRT